MNELTQSQQTLYPVYSMLLKNNPLEFLIKIMEHIERKKNITNKFEYLSRYVAIMIKSSNLPKSEKIELVMLYQKYGKTFTDIVINTSKKKYNFNI